MPVDLAYQPFLRDLRRLGGDKPLLEIAATTADRLKGLRRTPANDLAERVGFDTEFLGFSTPLPEPDPHLAADRLDVGGGQTRLDYTHFSVVMSRSKRMAMFVAVNINGLESKKVERTSDVWNLDGRIPDDAQIGEDLYAGNLLDRGHLVRREDPNWGSDSDAETANDDTFHFTNCAPQMGAFNQRTWLSLESYILNNARVQAARVNVFTGPVFREDDRIYRGVAIPTAFWKVIAFVDEAGKPSATAYIVDQVVELGALEVGFGAFKTYQRSVRSIQNLAGLTFGDLARFDGFSNEEAATDTTISAELASPDDIRA